MDRTLEPNAVSLNADIDVAYVPTTVEAIGFHPVFDLFDRAVKAAEERIVALSENR